MFKINKSILFLSIFIASIAHADIAAPLGIEVGKTTFEEVKAKYEITSTDEGDKDGYSYTLSTKNMPLKDIKFVRIIIDDKGVVNFIILQTDKSKFELYSESLSKKYKKIREEVPFVGNKIVNFQAENCRVMLISQHLESLMNIIYITEDLLERSTKNVEEEKKHNEKNINDAL
jgi:hypothetical protein